MSIKLIAKLFCLALSLIVLKANQNDLHCAKTKTIQFEVSGFQVVGNLYIPQDSQKNGLIIWIHGSGPDKRTNNFPGYDFFNLFLDNNYAYFRYDKPGSGDSKGELTDSIIFQQRAAIINAAIDTLKKIPLIDSTKIGLVGSSQAGYVMPLVWNRRDDIAFMVGLSLPAMDGIEQWGYLLKMQMICDGFSDEKAEEFSKMHVKLMRSKSEQVYLETLWYFEDNPLVIPSLPLYDKNFSEKAKKWWPLTWNKAQRFNPAPLIKEIDIPALIVYGSKDTQVNPIQGAREYKEGLNKAGNHFFEIEILPNTDHNMSVAETGCLKEQSEKKKWELSPNLIESTNKWLQKLDDLLNKN